MSPELREDIHDELGVALVACSLKGWRKTQEDTSAVSCTSIMEWKPRLGPGVVGYRPLILGTSVEAFISPLQYHVQHRERVKDVDRRMLTTTDAEAVGQIDTISTAYGYFCASIVRDFPRVLLL